MTAKIYSQGMMEMKTPEQRQDDEEKNVFNICVYDLVSYIPFLILTTEAQELLKDKFPDLYKAIMAIEKAIQKKDVIANRIEAEKGW